MCFNRTTNYKVSPGITCIKVMYFVNGKLIPEFHSDLKYELGDTIHAAGIPNIRLESKYWFKKKDYRYKIKTILAAQHIDDTCYSELGKEVVHSFSSEKRALIWRGGVPLVLVECLIPEGEIYWENKNAEQYASFSVKLVRILT